MASVSRSTLIALTLLTQSVYVSVFAAPLPVTVPDSVRRIIDGSCTECHNKTDLYGGLDLAGQSPILDQVDAIDVWTQVLDRVANGEMPPPGSEMSDERREILIKSLSNTISTADLILIKREGRSGQRRLTHREYERYLQDVLHLDRLDISDSLPTIQHTSRYEQVNGNIPVTAQEIHGYIQATEKALLQAVNIGEPPPPPKTTKMLATRMFAPPTTYGGREAMYFAKDAKILALNYQDLNKLRADDSHDPSVELAIFRSPSWPYYGYPHNFTSPNGGLYKIRFSARTVLQQADYSLLPASHPIPVTFRARKVSGPDVSGDVRATGGVIDIHPDTRVYETTIELNPTETFEYGLLGLPVPRPINPPDAPLYYKFPPMPDGGHPGIAFQWLEITGPLISDAWPGESHTTLCDDFEIVPNPSSTYGFKIRTSDANSAIEQLVPRFIRITALSRQTDQQTTTHVNRCRAKLLQGLTLEESLITTYASVLTENRFIAPPKPRDSRIQRHHAVDVRLSLFLEGALGQPAAERQGNRSTSNLRQLKVTAFDLALKPGFKTFTSELTDNWFDLHDIRRDSPDIRVYPEYRFDDYLIDSLYKETHAFVLSMFRENLPISNLVDSDFIFVNDKLAKHYELPKVSGSGLQKLSLPQNDPRGGLITHGAIAKITSNGTHTSPIVRGAWVLDRILGDPPPPPPPSIPAVEPDLRGSTTVGELLEKHSADASCRSCHAKFDPLGVAMENLDIMGAWRENYRSLDQGREVTGIDRAGHDYKYFIASPVESSAQFHDVVLNGMQDLKNHLLQNQRQIALNFLHQLALYATGVESRYSDRAVFNSILDECEVDGFRTMDLLIAFVQSPIFTGDWK